MKATFRGLDRPVKGEVHAISNRRLASRFEEMAERLELRGEDPFRVRAFTEAAQTLLYLDEPVFALVRRRGFSALCSLPSIGKGLASRLEECLRTGRIAELEALRRESGRNALLTQVPGVTERIARQLRRRLHVHTLRELELALAEGRVERLGSVGSDALATMHDSLARRFRRWRPAVGSP